MEHITGKLPESASWKGTPNGVHAQEVQEVDRVEGWQSGSLS